MGLFSGVIKALGLDPNDRAIARYEEKALIIDSFEPQVKDLSDEELAQSASFFKARLENGETLDDMLPEVFARVREVSVRTLGLRHFKEQLMGGMALHEGKIAEMKTGEGKTLVATLAVALNAIAGRGVHVITVNDYLAARDAEWMGPVYRGMGLSVGVISPFMDQEDRFARISPMAPTVSSDLIILGTTWRYKRISRYKKDIFIASWTKLTQY